MESTSSNSTSYCLRKGTPATSGVVPSTLFRLLHLNFTTLGSSSSEPLPGKQHLNPTGRETEPEMVGGAHSLRAYTFGSLMALLNCSGEGAVTVRYKMGAGVRGYLWPSSRGDRIHLVKGRFYVDQAGFRLTM